MIKSSELIELIRHYDERGFFQEICRNINFKQINYSFSKKNVLRGLHCSPYEKYCICIKGCLFDVVVDVKTNDWHGIWLMEEKPQILKVPTNCAHGFFAKKDSILLYMQTGEYEINKEKNYKWNDPKFGIVWPEADEYIISEKDA